MSRLLAFALLASLAAAEDITLVKDGKSDYVIVLAKDAAPAEEHGAKELQTYIKEMSGAELPIQRDVEGIAYPEHSIIIGGHTASANPPLGPEEFVSSTPGTYVCVDGGGPRGILYGCYDLLERLGVRWYTSKITRVPHQTTITLPFFGERQCPAFEYRYPFFAEAEDKDWAARNRTNGASMSLDDSVGGSVIYFPFVHTLDQLIPGTLFKDHPEYFALLNGKRFDGYGQRCLSNPDVLTLAIATVRGWIHDHPEAQIYSVSQNDCENWCQCDACKAIEDKYGAHSGLYLWFVNQVAEAIEHDHPEKLIDTLAYWFTEVPPHDIVPRKNVRVRLCPIRCCEAHPYESCTSDANKAFLAHLKAWGAMTDTLYIWHYNTDFAHYLMPFPDFAEFPAELRLYKRSGVKGVFFEGAYAPGGGGSDAELRSWVMARLLWNPDQDADALVTEWMKGVYGAAWEPMRKWFDRLHAEAAKPDRHLGIYDPPTHAIFSDEVIAAGDALFDEAEKLAAADAVAAEYVAKGRISLRYVKLARAPHAGPDLDAFLADVRRLGITQIAEGKSVDQWEAEIRKAAGGK